MKVIDVHTLKAMEIYQVKEEEVTFAMRQVAKQYNYMFAYGVKPLKDITPKK